VTINKVTINDSCLCICINILQNKQQTIIPILKVKNTLLKRTQIVKWIRNKLDDIGFIEFETPTLHAISGGADAAPFNTHHNSLGLDLTLRIATEVKLDVCLCMFVGGVGTCI
jgi:lysyl-tRNA synthetase class II